MSGGPGRRLFPLRGSRRPGTAGDGSLIRWHEARLAQLGAGLSLFNHDLRGVLAPALLAAERLAGQPDPATRRSGQVLLRAVERAMDLLRDRLAPLREGLPRPAREPVGLAGVIEAAAAGRLALQTDLPPDAAVEADPACLRDGCAALFAALEAHGATRAALSLAVEGRACTLTIETGPELASGDLFAAPPDGAQLDGAIARALFRACGGDLAMDAGGRVTATLRRR